MLRTIRLRGELGRRFGRLHKLAVDSPAEVIRALVANHPGFREFLEQSGESGVGYKVIVDDEWVGEDGFDRPLSRTMSITPVISGAGVVGKILAGVALLALAFTGIGMVVGTQIATMMAAVGASLVLGGIAQLLSSVPKAGQAAETKENPYFDGPQNTSAQGSAVPFGYGRMIVGSRIISAGITVEDQTSGGQAYMGGFPGDRGYNVNIP